MIFFPGDTDMCCSITQMAASGSQHLLRGLHCPHLFVTPSARTCFSYLTMDNIYVNTTFTLYISFKDSYKRSAF